MCRIIVRPRRRKTTRVNEEKPYVQPPDPLDIEGRPLNVLIQLQGTAAAYVRTAEIKQAYDAIIPMPAPAVEGAVLPPPRSVPQAGPFSAPRFPPGGGSGPKAIIS